MPTVVFPSASGEASGVLALPSVERAPALILVHEYWGVNDDMRRTAQRFADEGYLVLAIDLYHGPSTTDPAVAERLANELSTAEAMKDIEGARAWLAAHPKCTGKVGITGFCLGGAMALAAAFNVEGLAAALPFYGNPRQDFVHFDRRTPPIQGHYAKRDAFVDVQKTRAIADGVRAHGGSFELFEYDAGHAFMREKDAAAYQEDASKLAWKRSLAFLARALAG